MRAVVFDLSIPKYALAKALGKKLPSLHYGRASCLHVRDVPEPRLPNAAWAKIAVEAAGVCGSDIATVMFKWSPSLSPFSSFPAVLGHEVWGRVAELGADARAAGFKEGDRVAINPAIGCEVRSIAPVCPACSTGHTATCFRAGSSEGFAPGNCMGYHKQLGGGFAPFLVAHKSQLVPLSDALPDSRAVLVEPLGIGVHAVLRHPPKNGDRVLVIGGGMIAYSVLAALKLLGSRAQVTQLALLDYQAELARALGADDVWTARGYDALLEATCRSTGAARHKPILGPDVLTGGFDLTFDCIGAPESLRDSLAVTRSQGTVVLVGAAGIVPKLDLTAIWSREISIVGSCFYAPEPSRNDRHTLALTAELLASPEAKRVDALITHTFSIEQVREAIVANLDRGRYKSVKTVLTPRGAA